MNFKKEIDQAYSELGLIPINGQDQAVDRILTEFLVNDKRNLILSAQTGTGKSIIGAVVAMVFKTHFEDDPESTSDDYDTKINNAMIVVHSNNLVAQYGDTFKDFGSERFHQIIGANNYKCELNEAMNLEPGKTFTGEDCVKSKATPSELSKYCNNCQFSYAKSYVNKTDNLITNYSYHFINSMLSNHLQKRRLVIFDEAHTINDVFCDHSKIELSAEQLNIYIDECKGRHELKEPIAILNSIRNRLLRDELNEGLYVEPLRSLQGALSSIADRYAKLASESPLDQYVKFNKTARRYNSLSNKIKDLFTYKYDHSIEYDAKEHKFTVKPIFVGNMSKQIMSDYNLFMSATISDKFMKTTLCLDPDTTAYVELDAVYDPANKPVIFCGEKKLNYSSMKDPSTIKYLQDTVKEIVVSASADGYKGLMLTPSFALGETLSKSIPRGTKVFLHKPGMKAMDLIKEFKANKGPAILISPSMYEGVDFPGDLSSYQIIVKCPFPSLGDKRIEYIANKYPDIYKIMTIKKIVQGIGRSIRSKDDSAVTFILDQNAELLFKSPLNVWRNQFTIS